MTATMGKINGFLSEYNVILGTLLRGLAFLFLMVVAYLSKQVLEDVRDIKNMLSEMNTKVQLQEQQIQYLTKLTDTHEQRFIVQDDRIKDFWKEYGSSLNNLKKR